MIMGYDLINKVYIKELWLDEFVYPTTGKRVIRFEDYDENDGMCVVIKEVSMETFRAWLKTFYEMNPRKAQKTPKEWLKLHSVRIPIKRFGKKFQNKFKIY